MEAATVASSLPQVGDLLDDKYAIEALLGQGGMGAVFRATHVHTGRVVAVKVIVPAYARDESFLRRFEREARAAGSLRHPNIVDVTDFGYATTTRGRLAYLVMEYLEGCSLADVLRQQSGLPLAWSVDVLEQVGSAVEEAHRMGLLHRDLKPDNIWLEPNRKGGYTVKVLDFGLAKLSGKDESDAAGPRVAESGLPREPSIDEGDTAVRPAPTETPAFDETEATRVQPLSSRRTIAEADGATAYGSIVGTPAYMSPEQCKGLPLNPASDVYSLAVIAYRMLAGKLPFEGNSDAQLKAHIGEAPRDLAAVRKDLPPDASTLVMQALAKDPGLRPKSAGAFAAMLSARVQPTEEFLRSALFLFIQNLRTFVNASIFWLSPALLFVTVAAFLAILEAAEVGRFVSRLPTISLIFAPQILSVLGIFALQGALVPAVMQAIVAPLQPVDLRSLQKVFRGRMRGFLRGIAPVVLIMAVFFVWVGFVVWAMPYVVRPLRAELRAVPRPVAVVGLMLIILPITMGPLLLVRRSRAGSAMQFLGAIAMMEGRSGQSALDRAALLAKASGRALQAVTVGSLGFGLVVGIVLGLLSLALPRGLPPWASASIQSLAITPTFVFLAPFLSVVSALTYLRALKAAGESPDDVLRRFEQEILPPSHWKLASRERILTQIDATRG